MALIADVHSVTNKLRLIVPYTYHFVHFDTKQGSESATYLHQLHIEYVHHHFHMQYLSLYVLSVKSPVQIEERRKVTIHTLRYLPGFY